MTLPSELRALAEEFRIYARAECLPESARWEKWADTCEAGARDVERLEWLGANGEELFRDRAEDATGGWFCVRETVAPSKDRPLGEFVCEGGSNIRAAIDAAIAK